MESLESSEYNLIEQDDELSERVRNSSSVSELISFIQDAARISARNSEVRIAIDSIQLRATSILWEKASVLDENSSYDDLNEVLELCKDLVLNSYDIEIPLFLLLDLILEIVEEWAEDRSEVQSNHKVIETIKRIIQDVEYPNRQKVFEISETLTKFEDYRPITSRNINNESDDLLIDFKLLEFSNEDKRKIEVLDKGKKLFIKGRYNKKEAGIKVYKLNETDAVQNQEIAIEVKCLNYLGRSNHPSFIKYRGIHKEGNHLIYLVMDLGQRDLDEYIRIYGRFKLDKFLSFSKVILEGLNFMRLKRYYHGDIKPKNIIVDSNDKPKIIDFGASSIRDRDTETTQTEHIRYTPGYMAPEIPKARAQGDRSGINRMKTDVFSLGITFLKMLIGEDFEIPHATADTIAELLKGSLESVRKLHQSNNDKENLEKIMRFLPKMVEIEPENRIDLNAILSHFIMETQ